MGTRPEPEWELLREAASHLQRHGRHCFNMDLTPLRLAAQCLHSPQRLCAALGLPAASLASVDAVSTLAEGSTADWHERVVIVAILVQQLVIVLLTSLQAALALLGLSDGGITPPADVAAGAAAERVIELLAIHAELSAAAATVADAGATSLMPLALQDAHQLISFTAKQLSPTQLAEEQSRRRSSSRHSAGGAVQMKTAGSCLRHRRSLPLELAAYAVTMAQAAAAAALGGEGSAEDSAQPGAAVLQLACEAWHVYTAARGVRHSSAEGSDSRTAALHEALQSVITGGTSAKDLAAPDSAEPEPPVEVAESPPTPTITPCRIARASSASSGPSLPAQPLPMPESPPETPLQLALRRPAKMHSLPPSRRITPQMIQGPTRPAGAWANLQAAEQKAQEQWDTFLACKENLVMSILQEGNPNEYTAGTGNRSESSTSELEAEQCDEVSSPAAGGQCGRMQQASQPEAADTVQPAAVDDPDAEMRTQLLCVSLWLFMRCIEAKQVEAALLLGQLLPEEQRLAAVDEALLQVDPARSVIKCSRVKAGAKAAPCGAFAVLIAQHILEGIRTPARPASVCSPAEQQDTAALAAVLLASRIDLVQKLLHSAEAEEAALPAGKTLWPPRLLIAQLLLAALSHATPDDMAAVRISALRTWLDLSLRPQQQAEVLSREDRRDAAMFAIGLVHSLTHDLGPDAKPPRWGENLALSLPLGLLSSASLLARRGALRTLLGVLLARDQALLRQARQVAPEGGTLAEHTGGMAARPLSDVGTALLRRLWREVQGASEGALISGARLQALVVEVSHMALVHATCAAKQLAVRLSASGPVDWNWAVQCMNGRQLAALLCSAPLQGVLDNMGARKTTQRQLAWRTVIEQQRHTFVAAEAALQVALQDAIASGRPVHDMHRGRVLRPAEVLRTLQAPAVVPASGASSDVKACSSDAAAGSDAGGATGMEGPHSGSAPCSGRRPQPGGGSHRSRKKRKTVLANSYIASIAEAEPGFDRTEYDSGAESIDSQTGAPRGWDPAAHIPLEESADVLLMKDFIVCKKGRSKADYKQIVQEINKRASAKPRLMTGTAWQPAATCGEADCSEDDGSGGDEAAAEEEEDDTDSQDVSASLSGSSSDEDAGKRGTSSLDAAC